MIYYNIILIKVAFFVSFITINALNRLSIRPHPSILDNINLIKVLQLNIKLNYNNINHDREKHIRYTEK